MRPSLSIPYHDPDGVIFPHLIHSLPDLKTAFGRIYLCPNPGALRYHELVDIARNDAQFTLFELDQPLPTGEHFKHLYLNTALSAHADEIIHLAYPDRLSFALETEHRSQFLADIASLNPADLPLIFHRSPLAWATHPKNYARLEGFVTRLGEQLFGKTLDYGWCHLVVRAGELREVMPRVTHPGISMVAEMILHLQHHIHTRDVDWLSWEDPYLLERDPVELKTERENDPTEYEKRLNYCLPMAEALVQFSMIH